MTQFVEFTRFVQKETKVGQAPSRVSVNVAHITAVVTHPEGGTVLRFVGSGDNEHVDEAYSVVMRTLNR
jgi:hypothetical protein